MMMRAVKMSRRVIECRPASNFRFSIADFGWVNPIAANRKSKIKNLELELRNV
jgi:hypothetical protein